MTLIVEAGEVRSIIMSEGDSESSFSSDFILNTDKSCQTSINTEHCAENSKKLKFGIDAILSSENSAACRSNKISK